MRLWSACQLSDPSVLSSDTVAHRYVSKYEALGCRFLRNVSTRMLLLDTGTHQFPVSVNDGEEDRENCYVISPVTAYGAYALEEVRRLKSPFLKRALTLLVRGMSASFGVARLDRIVYVNNWLLSTNLYPSTWEGDDLRQITEFLTDRFPDHSFGFRSLNWRCHRVLLERMQRLGYTMVPSRQVYLFDGTAGQRSSFLGRHNTRLDAALWRQTGYRILRGEQLMNDDFQRLEQLYNKLYLEKYSRLNPHYSADWLRAGQRDGWLELRVLRGPCGALDGVLGWFAADTTLSAPIVGYDTALSRREGLYRLLTRHCLQEAADRRVVLNFSSGASHFKRLRGGDPEIEFSMIYSSHLPLHRRAGWTLLGRLLHGIGVPLMRTLEL